MTKAKQIPTPYDEDIATIAIHGSSRNLESLRLMAEAYRQGYQKRAQEEDQELVGACRAAQAFAVFAATRDTPLPGAQELDDLLRRTLAKWRRK